MKKTILLFAILALYAIHADAFVRHKGSLDTASGEFYFTGLDFYRWSGNKLKEYSDAWHKIYKYNFQKKERLEFYDAKCHIQNLTLSYNKENLVYLCNESETLKIINRKAELILVLPQSEMDYAAV